MASWAAFASRMPWPSLSSHFGPSVLLAVLIHIVLRFLGSTRGWGLVRGLGLVAVGLFLAA